MDKLYRFSPIETEKELHEAVVYVSEKVTELCKKITGEEFSIDSLTIFSHYSKEFESLKQTAINMGELESEHNGPYVKLNNPIKLKNNKLSMLRIRQPDPYRMQVGCNDFSVSSYKEFKERFLSSKKDNLRLIERPDYEMIEFFDPDFDVLSYVLSGEI